jgi:two-component system response regulator (stage 0 sporulation protein A)
MSKIRVLIGDNCEDYAVILSAYMSTLPDIEIIGIANDGDAVVKILQQTPPDILLLDIVMPKLDGFDILNIIDKMDNKPTVFIMSALNSKEIIAYAFKMGASKYYIKPFPMESLITGIMENERAG